VYVSICPWCDKRFVFPQAIDLVDEVIAHIEESGCDVRVSRASDCVAYRTYFIPPMRFVEGTNRA